MPGQSIDNPFTPEPWTVSPSQFYGHYVLHEAFTEQELAEASADPEQLAVVDARDQANARLMQAAPQLLAVARSLLAWGLPTSQEATDGERFLVEAQAAALRAIAAAVEEDGGR